MSLEKSIFVMDNDESLTLPVGGVRLIKQLSVPPDFNSSGEIPASFMARQTSSRSLGHSSSTAESSFDSLSPEPLSVPDSSEEQSTPVRNRIRRSETLPPTISSEGNSAEIPNGNMAAGLDHGGSSLSSPDRLAPALSYPCLVTATTASTSTTIASGSGGIGSVLLSSSPNLAATSSSSANPSTTLATTPATEALNAPTLTLNPSALHGSNTSGGGGLVPTPASSSSPLNSSCNGSNDESQHPCLTSGTPPSPILGQSQTRPSRSRSPSSASPTRRRGQEAGGGGGSIATGSNDSSSREASLEKVSGVGVAMGGAGGGEVSLDQISVEGGESGSAGSMRSFEHLPRNATSGPESINGSKRSGGKRKSAWYQMLNPTYRSRCEDFKRIFKDLPVDERLIVDYSCALQRDILLQGRIYVTQNYLCFYANIFRWETLVQLRWKEVSSLTKEKTALVIPNAIQICTETDKHFFCSFGARDKTYVVLFRTWQQALLDQPLGNQELWKFVHSVYGTELGFSSNDEAPSSIVTVGDGGISASAGEASPLSEVVQPSISLQQQQQYSSPSPSLHSAQTSNDDDSGVLHPVVINNRHHRHHHQQHHFNNQLNSRRHQVQQPSDGSDWRDSLAISSGTSAGSNGGGATRVVGPAGIMPTGIIMADATGASVVDADVPPPYSDTTESEDERYMSDETIQCPLPHEGREMVNMAMPMSVDELFTLLFTNSSFYIDFIQTTRKCTDLEVNPWKEAETNPAAKFRTVAFTIPLNNNIGVKSTRAVESQTLSEASRPGDFYAIDVEASNSGIPYAETFAVCCHWCLMRCGYRQSRLVIHSQIKYKKSVWGIVKTFIEKNAWAALEENFSQMKRNLLSMQSSRDAEDVRIERRAELPASPSSSLSAGTGVPKKRHGRVIRRRGKDENGLMEKRGMNDGSQMIVRSSGSVKQTIGRSKVVTSSSSSSSSSPSPSPSSGRSAVFYVVLVSLVLLLCTNGFLFSKIWALEQLAEELARHPPSCLSAANMADLRVLTAQPKSPEEWMRILRQQETLYRSTELKWRSTLSAMSGFLRQTQESLTNLEKEMEPDSDLIRAILEKIQPPASLPAGQPPPPPLLHPLPSPPPVEPNS